MNTSSTKITINSRFSCWLLFHSSQNRGYAASNYSERLRIQADVKRYLLGSLYYMANDHRVPNYTRFAIGGASNPDVLYPTLSQSQPWLNLFLNPQALTHYLSLIHHCTVHQPLRHYSTV